MYLGITQHEYSPSFKFIWAWCFNFQWFLTHCVGRWRRRLKWKLKGTDGSYILNQKVTRMGLMLINSFLVLYQCYLEKVKKIILIVHAKEILVLFLIVDVISHLKVTLSVRSYTMCLYADTKLRCRLLVFLIITLNYGTVQSKAPAPTYQLVVEPAAPVFNQLVNPVPITAYVLPYPLVYDSIQHTLISHVGGNAKIWMCNELSISN